MRQAGFGVLTAVAITQAEAVQAQSEPNAELPALTVEAQAAKPETRTVRRVAVPRPQSAQRRVARPAASPAPVQTAPSAPATPSGSANASPYAAAGAPYNVQRSSSGKLTEPMANTARTITAIPKEVLEDKGATSLRELARTTPGLTLGTGEGGNAFGDRVFIRGFDARNDMYIDGVRESGVTTRETFNAEQVEITKGPAGSISGRGTSGGSINVVTKKPLEPNFTNINTTLGMDATKRMTVDINQNISPVFAIRANGLVQDAEVAGRDYVKDQRYGGALSLQWKPTEIFTATLDYSHLEMKGNQDWGVPFDPRTRRPFTESGLNRNNYYGITSRDFQRNTQDIATGTLEWKVRPDFTVNSKFRYNRTVTDYVASKPGTPDLRNPNPALWTVASTPVSRYQVNEMLANQTDMTWKFQTFGLKHTLVAGLEASRENISQDSYTGLSIECFPTCSGTTGIITNLWWPTTHLVPSTGSLTLNRTPAITKVDTVSGYVLDTISWNDRLFLNLGMRFDKYQISRTPFGAATLSRDDLLFNWNAGLTYKILPNAAIYVAYGTSSNPVGAELDAGAEDYGGLDVRNVLFRPERNTSVELGTKWELFDKRLLVTAALFQTEKRYARETIGTGATAFLDDTAAYRIRGVELGIGGNITDRWSVFGGAVFMQSRVTKSAIATNIGRPLANIAHQSFNLLTKYKVTDQLTIGAQATYKSEILGGTLVAASYAAGTVNVGGVTTATPAGYNKLPGGWRFDVMADYEINKNFSVNLLVQNVFDKKLYDGFYRSSTPYVYIAPGRAGWLTVKAKF